VYLPYEKADNADNVDEFLFQLSITNNITTPFTDCHIIVGGHFNTHFARLSSLHTNMLTATEGTTLFMAA